MVGRETSNQTKNEVAGSCVIDSKHTHTHTLSLSIYLYILQYTHTYTNAHIHTHNTSPVNFYKLISDNQVFQVALQQNPRD